MAGSIKVQDVDVKAERRKRLRRRGGRWIAGLGCLAVAAGATWYFTPPSMPDSIEQARALVDSPRFARLSQEAKQPYYDVIREQYGSLNRDERRKLREADDKLREAMRDAGRIQMRQMLVQMAELTPDERDAMMSTFGRGRPGGSPRGERPERTPDEQAERAGRMRDHISDRMANGDSQMNQLMREMFSQRRNQNKN